MEHKTTKINVWSSTIPVVPYYITAKDMADVIIKTI